MVLTLTLTGLPTTAGAQVVNSVLVYTGGGVAFGYQGHTAFAAATGKTVVVSDSLPEELPEYDCVILPGNVDLSEAQDELVSYVANGGRLIAEANGEAFLSAISAMNGLASALGSSMSVFPAGFDPGPIVTTAIDESPFTAGVTSVTYGYTSGVSVGDGQGLVRIQSGEHPTFIGAELIGEGLFVLSGDSNVFSDVSGDGYTAQDNGVLASNICDQVPLGAEGEEVDLSVSKVAEQASVTAGGQAAFTVTVTNNSETVATGVQVVDSATFGEGSVEILSASGDG
ncbi:MAG TPA: hypothetical protein VIA81_04175, partial [Acidimicrobiia bacterium]